MIKLKDLLEGKNYNSPGYENRQFGDPLPTLEDITRKYQEGKESVDENILKQIQQAEKIAKSMAGNMTGAVKGIEKIRRGLSRHKRVKIALKKANESVTEETINEAPEQQMASQLNKVSDTILKITDKFKGKADVDGMTRSWMMGLHARLKKAGIKS
tara:strand:- start:6566 stop:7036 length:471 start_codon:yes stop_codon:yes gene_type:complete